VRAVVVAHEGEHRLPRRRDVVLLVAVVEGTSHPQLDRPGGELEARADLDEVAVLVDEGVGLRDVLCPLVAGERVPGETEGLGRLLLGLRGDEGGEGEDDERRGGEGGAFNYSDEENDVPPPGQATLTLVRDNYRSRDARLDLAWGKVKLGPVVAEGGRFFMPLPLTEMIWDRDLRPQGGAVALEFTPQGSTNRFAFQGIYTIGSHVFEDESVMYGGGADLTFGSADGSSLQLAGSYLQFQDLNKLEPVLRRQNTQVAGLIAGDYRVVDLIARLTRGGQLPLQLVADYCWNTALDSGNRGLWVAVALGDLGVSRTRLEYTYAAIDHDATVAAFNTDDFFWGTGWEGHRGDFAMGTVKSSSIHAIAQWQRFKDSPDPTIRDQWVTRYRLEWRTSF